MFSKFSHLVYDYCWTNFLNFSSQYNGYKKFKNVAGLANFINNETNMVNVLNVAEKNDAAKSIANIMSNGSAQRREGISKFNKIYQFKYKLNNQNVNMVMTSVSGHLLQYEFVGSYRKWNGCKPETLFDAPMIKECPEAYLPIKKTLEREVCNAQHLIIWTDGDREGENIGFEIINVCKHVNPNIKVSRAKFSEITQKSITRTCQSLCSPDSNTSIAVDIRQELDLRIGAAFTRFQTLRLKKVFPNHLAERLISYGSCQFPTLGFVVERYKQVQSFVPEPFWKIKVTHQQEDSTIEFNWKRVRLFSQPACFVIFEKCLQNPAAKVINIQSKSKSKWRPLPLDTVELEKLSSRKLKLGAKETMQIAEKLYTSGYISYPRTETNMFPKDFNLVNLVEMQSQSEEWGDFAKKVLIHGPNPRQGKKTDNAHPPIHPIKYTNNLSGKEKKVYEFIVRHFLASVSKDALGHETTVEIEISEEQFSANGLMIIERNYLDVYPYEKWNAKVIPVYAMAQVFSPSSIEMPESETSPPLLLTEADLIALMEKHGIGTDATHADHIETIKSRMYVGVNANERFVPGELGMGLVEGYDQMGFEMSKPYLRAELEADLQRICEGVKDPKEVLSRQIENYRRVFKQSIEQHHADTTFFPNVRELLSILAVLPLGSCEAEMSFSCVRRIHSWLRSSMSTDRLSDLCVIAMHGNIPVSTEEIAMCFRDEELQPTMPLTVLFLFVAWFKQRSSHLSPGINTGLTETESGQSKTQRTDANVAIVRTLVLSDQILSAVKLDEALSKHFGPPTAFTHAVDSTFFFNLNSGTSTRGHALKVHKFYIGCMSYPNCKSSIWFPNYVESVSIDNSVCQQCEPGPIHLLKFKFRPGSMRPYYPNEYTGCIGGCDNLFLESLGIQSTPRNVPNITSSDIASTFSNENEISNNRTYSLDSGYTSFNSRENNRSSSQNPRQNPSVFTSARSVADSHASSSFSNCNNSQRNLNSRRNTDLSQHNPPVRQIQMNASTSNISNASTSAGRSSSSRISPPPEEPVTLVCGCGHDAILLTVRKAGKNQGRQFYKCSKSEGSGCDFFQWADYQVDENSSNFSDPSHALCTLKHPQCSFQIVVKVGAVPLTFKIVRTMCVYWAIERSEVGIRPRSGARSDIPKAEAYLATPGESGDFSYNCSNKIPIFFHSKFLFPFYFIRSLAQRSDYLIQNYKMSILEIPQKETQEEESVLFVINQVLFLTSNLRNYRYEYVMSISSHLCIILWVWNNLIIVLLNGNNNNNRNQIFLRTQKRGGRKKNTNYSNESCFRKKKYFLPLTRIKPAHPSLQVWCAIRYTTEVNGVY
ncbi:DNA topoisomerase 3-alpha [Nymphon striatum]|nr:DNA topoisomerase 3-alpha [Nymphon striatum]